MKTTVIPNSGTHAGHVIQIWSHSYNCGADNYGAECSCGASYLGEMRGCWQEGHQRDEEGDVSLWDAYLCRKKEEREKAYRESRRKLYGWFPS